MDINKVTELSICHKEFLARIFHKNFDLIILQTVAGRTCLMQPIDSIHLIIENIMLRHGLEGSYLSNYRL